LSKKKERISLIEKIAYRVLLFFFRKASILKKSATKALMEDLSDLNIVFIDSMLKFHDCNITDIMTPRTEICAIDINSRKDEIIEKIRNTCYTKLLVYRNNFDNILGFFYVKDILFSKNKDFNLKSIIQNIIFVPPSMKTTNLFIKMQSSKSCLAVVLDEYGGTYGLISISDLIWEMLPTFYNENEPYNIIELSYNIFEVPAKILIKDIEEVLNIKLRDPDEDYVTLGGLVLSIAGKVPSTNEIIEYKSKIKFIIKDANERYINRIILDLSNYTEHS
jgi:magnesium and cobalt transporter